MKVLITGGAGYIGSALCQELSFKENVDVTVVDRFKYGAAPIASFLKNPRFRFVKGDVRDDLLMKELISSHDIVVHLAALVGTPACDADPYEANSVNLDGTAIVSSHINKGQRLLFASTGVNYGKVEGDICDENTPLKPETLYAKTKVAGENLVLDAGGIVLRLATLFGLSGRPRDDLLVNNLVRDAVTNRCLTIFQGGAKRSFLALSDAARCFSHVMMLDATSYNVIDVGDKSLGLTKSEVAQQVSKITGAYIFEKDYYSDPDHRDYIVPYKRLSEIGFEARAVFLKELKILKEFYDIGVT